MSGFNASDVSDVAQADLNLEPLCAQHLHLEPGLISAIKMPGSGAQGHEGGKSAGCAGREDALLG